MFLSSSHHWAKFVAKYQRVLHEIKSDLSHRNFKPVFIPPVKTMTSNWSHSLFFYTRLKGKPHNRPIKKTGAIIHNFCAFHFGFPKQRARKLQEKNISMNTQKSEKKEFFRHEWKLVNAIELVSDCVLFLNFSNSFLFIHKSKKKVQRLKEQNENLLKSCEIAFFHFHSTGNCWCRKKFWWICQWIQKGF